MSKKPLFTAAAILGALTLSGCEDNDVISYSQPSPEEINEESRRIALNQLNQEKEVAQNLLREMSARDPSVVDVYFTLDENGQRTLAVAREQADGSIEEWQAPAEDIAAIEAQANQEASSGSSMGGFGSTLLAAAMGYMMANAFMNTMGRTSQSSRDAHARERRMQSSAYNNTVSNDARSRAQSQASATSRSRGGSFGSTGNRSSGYSRGA